MTHLDELNSKFGEDYVVTRCPMPGKNSWTVREYMQAVEEDKPLENNTNHVDDFIEYINYKDKLKKDIPGEPCKSKTGLNR